MIENLLKIEEKNRSNWLCFSRIYQDCDALLKRYYLEPVN